jgi:SPP1 gp7 family putative phage head morphogenesis protein
MARTSLVLKELPDVGQDEGLWLELRDIMEPAMVQEMARAYRLGFIIAVLEMDAILKDFQADVVARADAMLSTVVQGKLQALGLPQTEIRMMTTEGLERFIQREFYSNWWDRWSETTRARVSGNVNLANQNGDGTRALAKRMEGMFGKSRASMIAATELTNISGIANQTAYRQAGFTQWEWRTAADRRVDPVCQALDGEVFDMAVTFSAAHPRCRCWPVPVPDSLGKPRPQRGPVSEAPRPQASENYPPDFPEEFKRKGNPFPEGGFSSQAEGAAWFSGRYPWIQNSVRNIDLPLMNQTLRAFDDLMGRFPWVGTQLRSFGTRSSGGFGREFAHATRDGRLLGLSDKWYAPDGQWRSKLESSLRDAEDQAWFGKGGGTVEAIVAHEFGHLMDAWLRSDFFDGAFGIGNKNWVSWIQETKMHRKHYTSTYGRESAFEGFAETFSEWHGVRTGRPGSPKTMAEASPSARAFDAFVEAIPPETWRPGNVLYPTADGTKPTARDRKPPEIDALNKEITAILRDDKIGYLNERRGIN